MVWKYAVREYRSHIVMSVLCLVQAVFLFAIVMGLLSVFMLRYSGYQPVQKLLEQDGFLTDMVSSVHLEGDAEGRPVQSSEAYEEMLKNADVYGQYEVSAFAGENQEIAEKREKGYHFSNVRAYDDEWLQGFVPTLQSGRWLKTGNTEGRWLEAVVLQSSDTYKVGDVEYLDSNSETKLKTRIPVKIVGIIDRNSDIIYQSNQSGSVDYHMLFSNMAGETKNLDEISYTDNMTHFIPETFFVSKKNLDSVQEQYVSLEAEENLSENYENVLRTEKTIFQTNLNGVVMIVMKQNGSTEELAYNRNRIAQISQFDFLHDLSYIKKNTWHNIMANISDMIPIGAGMILFTMISFVTLSTLMYQKNMRKYSIYYMYGLTWRNIFWIHILYISLIVLAALVFGMVVLYGAGYLGIWKAMEVK